MNTPGELDLELVARPGQLWLRRVGGSDESPVTKLPDGRYAAGGQLFVLVTGDKGVTRYLHIAGHALLKQ